MGERIRRAGQISWAVTGLAVLLAMVLALGWVVRVIWPPMVLAGAIVFLLNPVVTRMQQRGVPRALGTAATYLGLIALVVLIGLLVAPQARQQWDSLADDWPELRGKLEDGVNDWSERSREGNWPVQIPTVDELEEALLNPDASVDGVDLTPDERQARLFDQIDTARELALRVFNVGLIFVIGPIVAFYLLVDLPHIRRVVEDLIPASRLGEAQLIGRRLSQAIGGFFRGQLGVALAVGVMVSAGLAVLDLPFWLVVGMIAGFFNMVPLIGPWVGAVPGVIVALTTRDVGTAMWVIAVMVGVQQIDNNFISPVVMQRTVNLHPAAVMLALLAGGTLGGFFGMLLAVPLTAVLKIVVGHLWRTYVLGEPIEKPAAVEVAVAAVGSAGE